MCHKVAGEPRGPVFAGFEGLEQSPEALHLEDVLRDFAAPVGGPEPIVDRAIDGEDAGRGGQAEAREGRAQGGPLGAVEVEKRAVEVEKDGPDP